MCKEQSVRTHYKHIINTQDTLYPVYKRLNVKCYIHELCLNEIQERQGYVEVFVLEHIKVNVI
jgi:hypothetical protein